MRWCAYWLYARQRFDDEHRRATVRTDEGGLNGFSGHLGVLGFYIGDGCNVQQFACSRKVLTTPAIGDQPIVADAMKATWQDVQ